MIRAAALAALLLSALLFPSAASAQVSNNQIAYGSVMKAPIGAWADYRISKEGGEVMVRYTLVAHDAKKVSIEIDSETPTGHIIMRMDFTPDAKDKARWQLTNARLKTPDGQLKDMPIPADRSAGFGKSDSFGDKVGREDLSTPAGKFSAEHYRRAGTDVWMDDKVLPVGMVKLSNGESRVELVRTGLNGKGTL
jgi:hypothetical protein